MKKAILIIMILLLLPSIMAEVGPTINFTSTTNASECNTTSVLSDNECKPCQTGWNKHNTTTCVFSKECLENYEWSEELNACQKNKEAPIIKCVNGYKPVRLPNRTRTYDNNTGLATYAEWTCEQTWFTKSRNTITIIMFTILITCFTIWVIKKKKTKKGEQ